MNQKWMFFVLTTILLFALIIGIVSFIDQSNVFHWIYANPFDSVAYLLFCVGVSMAIKKITFKHQWASNSKRKIEKDHFIFFSGKTVLLDITALLVGILIFVVSFSTDRINFGFSILALSVLFAPSKRVIYWINDQKYYLDDLRFSEVKINKISYSTHKKHLLVSLIQAEPKKDDICFSVSPEFEERLKGVR